MNNVLVCNNLTKTYGQGEQTITVLDQLSVSIAAGELVAVVGRSGCGKSTFLHLAGALDKPSSGQVLINNLDIQTLSDKQRAKFRNQHIGFIYQFHHLMMEFSALENVAMPLLIRGDAVKVAQQKAMLLLEQVGLANKAKNFPAQLSGGERQRVAIARALVTEPSLVLADEPTGNLDSDTAEQIFQLLVQLNQQVKTSFVVVTHDLTLASRMQRQLKLHQGKLIDMELTLDANKIVELDHV